MIFPSSCLHSQFLSAKDARVKRANIALAGIALLCGNALNAAEDPLAGLNLDNQDPPKSLLNSRRMYLQLLKAFDGMDRARESQPGQPSPYVNELDLFVTTTDIKGAVLPLQLSDKIVYEKRHRNVFHFKYGTHQEFGQDRNHFLRKYNPFLAFAARCTSSFPFAFEPMRLCELDGLLQAFGDKDHNYAATSGATSDLWKPFFKERSDVGSADNQQDDDSASFLTRVGTRSFGDGGYLDNKPFSYATETLARRQSNVPVERKLVYIEPSPEHAEDERQNDTPPNVFANAKAALLDLPTYETIREDLQRVLRRNRTFQRINKIVEATNQDLENNGRGQRRYKFHSGHWRLLDMAMMVKYCGIYFLPYRRLRIASVTDELASLVARMKNVDERSDSLIAVRGLLRAWRTDHYVENYNPENTKLVNSVLDDRKPVEKPKPPEQVARKLKLPPEFPDSFQLLNEETYNAFLDDFDFGYRFRRLTFVLAKIDELMRIARESSNPQTFPSASPANPEDAISLINQAGVENAIGLLNYLKCELLEVHKTLRTTARKLQSAAGAARRSKNAETRPLNRLVDANLDEEIAEFYNEFRELKLDSRQLKFILGIPGDVSDEGDIDLKGGHGQEFAELNEKVCEERAIKLYQSDATLNRLLKNIASKLKMILSGRIIVPTSNHCKQLLNSKGELPEPLSASCARLDISRIPPDAKKAVRDYLYEYYIHFDDYDQVRFPILYQTEFGESAEVDIFRISPEDAPNLINERGPGSDGRKKLAGNALFHFGAFLDRVWRENDIMWGRLDGAERLITALMPDPDHQLVRDKLISDAHLAILQEEMPPATQLQLSGLLSEALIRASSGEPFEEAVEKVMGPLKSPRVKQRLATAMRACLEDEKLLNFVKEHYEVNRELEPKPLLRSMARATQVTGRIFDDVAQAHQVDSKSIRWIARAGQIFWGLVEVAVPGSLPSLLFRRWLTLLYAFEIVLLVLATFVISTPGVATFAWKLVGLTLATNFAVFVLRDYMRGKRQWLRIGGAVVFAMFAFFAVVGFDELANTGYRKKILNFIHRTTKGAIGSPREAAPPIPVLVTFGPSSATSPAASPTATPSPPSPARSP